MKISNLEIYSILYVALIISSDTNKRCYKIAVFDLIYLVIVWVNKSLIRVPNGMRHRSIKSLSSTTILYLHILRISGVANIAPKRAIFLVKFLCIIIILTIDLFTYVTFQNNLYSESYI